MFAQQLTRRLGLRPQFSPVGRRFQSTSVMSWSHFKKFLPKVELKESTTLGEVYDSLWTRYRYRHVYPIAAWVLFLWYNLWGSYAPESEKKKQLDRIQRLMDLEYRLE
ncbi:hypothetical protein HK098_004830 [Nowakowskiella sp. JEL0407]|nr:hypothetical protein HK098_004830 [Nowakowskiella sp. JEL0407]